MVLHCVDDYNPEYKVTKVLILERLHGYGIEVFIKVPFKTHLTGSIHELQAYIHENIEKFTGIALEEVDITVDAIA